MRWYTGAFCRIGAFNVLLPGKVFAKSGLARSKEDIATWFSSLDSAARGRKSSATDS
jgi:hypothetical protein